VIDTLFAAAARRRRARLAAPPERRRTLARPVISIGNVSVGGSGKSPLVAHVAELLLGMGQKPAILSRGYARPRPVDGAVVVSDGERVLADYDVAGDEPLMLARQLPGCAVVVCPDRYVAGSLAERRLGCSVHILDDGFQHLQLARALDIVILRRDDFGQRVMPLGRLREPLEAVRSAGAVVVRAEEASDGGMDDAARGLGVRRVFRMSAEIGPALAEPAFAFAGIGRPGEFFDALRSGGWTVAGARPFADHYRYSAADLRRLAEAACGAGARVLVTTEKDAARLKHGAALPDVRIVAVPMRVRVEPAPEFAVLLEQACFGSPR
jgi:tetraacyldisaccharide 4'-kinase